MNSFAQNINYIAGLDNVYGSKVELYKNNLSLKNVEHDIELKFSYYNNDDKKIHSIIHSEPGVLVGEINDVLLSFKSLVDAAISGSEFTCTVSSGVQNFVVNNVVMISIAIDSNNDTYKAYELEAKVITAGVVTYDVFGEVSDTLKIIPSLAMITSSDINAIANVYEIQDEVINVSNNVASITTVSDSIENVNITGNNITNVNIVGDDIANVNTVSTHISNVDTVSQSITDVNTVSDSIVDVGIVSTNIASINTVANAQNLADVIRVADDLNSLDVNGIADITIVANDLVLGTDSNIITVSDSIVDVNTVSDSIDNVNTVGTNITDVITVSTNIANVNITATDIASVNNVSSNIADVNTVSYGISNVNIVSSSITNVNTVATNIVGLNSIASNLTEILSADENADIATEKALEASNSASAALVFKNAASVSADNANASEANALASANSAIASANTATTKANEASDSATSASASAASALASKVSAENSATTATTKASEALSSSDVAINQAGIAITKATEASYSANSALIYKNESAANSSSSLASANSASVSEANALSYKDSALSSKNSAAASEANALSYSNLANTSELNSQSSAASAAISSINASNSEISSANNASVSSTKALEASSSANSALLSKDKAEKWASELEDIPVEPGKYSAMHWALKTQELAKGDSDNISYDNVNSGLIATNVHDAIDELDESIDVLIDNTYTKTEIMESLPNIGLDLAAGVVVTTGQIAWNADEGTADLGLSNGSTLQIGQENVRTVRNSTASTITNGILCMFDGTIGNSGRIKVKPFTAGFDEAMYLYGVSTQNIISQSDGIITIEGKVRGINTSGSSVGEVWSDGDILYAKPNDNGRMTNVVPADNELKLVVATVIHAHTNGVLEIRFTPMNENMYYTKVQNDILLNSKVPLEGDFTLDLGGIV